ncbi:MAG: helix-turn-helix domain-containing protein [Clostridium sp.]
MRCNYNKSETARELNLHRQSLIYRLKKIEELTGLSLNDHDSLYLLESCLRLLRLI